MLTPEPKAVYLDDLTMTHAPHPPISVLTPEPKAVYPHNIIPSCETHRISVLTPEPKAVYLFIPCDRVIKIDFRFQCSPLSRRLCTYGSMEALPIVTTYFSAHP